MSWVLTDVKKGPAAASFVMRNEEGESIHVTLGDVTADSFLHRPRGSKAIALVRAAVADRYGVLSAQRRQRLARTQAASRKVKRNRNG